MTIRRRAPTVLSLVPLSLAALHVHAATPHSAGSYSWAPPASLQPMPVWGHTGGQSRDALRRLLDQQSRVLAAQLLQVWQICQQLGPEYRVDCIAEEYKVTAARIAPDSAFAPMRQVLTQAAATLERAVEAQRDRRQPRVSAVVGTRRTAPITPVRPEAAAVVNTAAARIVEEAGLTLLRSVPDEDVRAASFQRIASAFDDTAVLLRS